MKQERLLELAGVITEAAAKPRDYERDPIIIEAKIRVMIYADVPDLEKKLKQATTDRDAEEAALSLVGGYFNEGDTGLDEFSIKRVK